MNTHPIPFMRRISRKQLLLIIVLLSAACLLSGFAFLAVRQITLAISGTGLVDSLAIANDEGDPALTSDSTPIPDTAPIAPSTNPWDGAGRVTILVLGLDYRDWSTNQEASRSDTMILLTLDPLSKTAGMLSIPRDLWVSIPGFHHGKINTAYYLGDAHQLPGGGPALAVKTVETLLGVPINYYAQIDFGAFVRFIDEIGGVKINVPEPITIDLLGSGHKTKKKLKPGEQVLPGEWALAYARARYTEGGDFDRAQRQQQVILGIRDRILSFDLLPTLISKAPTLYNELASGINTNLSLDEALKLSVLAVDISEDQISKGIINEQSVVFGKSPDGLDILIPIPDKIHLLRDQIFAASGGLGPETPGDARQQMQTEGSRIFIFNGSSNPGIADRTAEYLRSQGANVLQVANADQHYSATTIVDHSGSPYALKYLVDLMSISTYKIFLNYDPGSSVDVELYLGDDWASQNSLP